MASIIDKRTGMTMKTTRQFHSYSGSARYGFAMRVALVGSLLLLGGCAGKFEMGSLLAGDENCLDTPKASASQTRLSADCVLLQRQAYEKALGLMTVQIFR